MIIHPVATFACCILENVAVARMQKKVPVPHGPDLPVRTPPKRLLDAFPENTTTSDSEHEVGNPETVGGSDLKR